MTQSTTLGSRYRLEEMDTEMKRKHPLKRSSLRWLPIYGSCPLIFRMLLWFGLVISVVPSISETKDQCSRYVSGYWNNSFHRKWNSASYLCYKEGVEVLMKGSWGWGGGSLLFFQANNHRKQELLLKPTTTLRIGISCGSLPRNGRPNVSNVFTFKEAYSLDLVFFFFLILGLMFIATLTPLAVRARTQFSLCQASILQTSLIYVPPFIISYTCAFLT